MARGKDSQQLRYLLLRMMAHRYLVAAQCQQTETPACYLELEHFRLKTSHRDKYEGFKQQLSYIITLRIREVSLGKYFENFVLVFVTFVRFGDDFMSL